MKMVNVDPLSLMALEALRQGTAAFAAFRAEHPELTLIGYNDGWTKDVGEELVTEGPDLIDVDEHAEVFWFKGVDLAQVNMSGLKIFHVDFDRSDLTEARLVGCDIRMCSFDQANMQRADLSKSKISDSNFRIVDLRFAQLCGITLGEQCSGPVQFHWAVMAGVDMTDATLDHGDFMNADLQQADFTNAKGKSMNFYQATVKKLKGLESASLAHRGRMIGEDEYMTGVEYFKRLAESTKMG